MFRRGYKPFIMVQKCSSCHQYCGVSTFTKTAEEVKIPVPWGHIAGNLAILIIIICMN